MAYSPKGKNTTYKGDGAYQQGGPAPGKWGSEAPAWGSAPDKQGSEDGHDRSTNPVEDGSDLSVLNKYQRAIREGSDTLPVEPGAFVGTSPTHIGNMSGGEWNQKHGK